MIDASNGWVGRAISRGGYAVIKKTLYVGNLLYSVTLKEVTDLFAVYGTIHDAKLVVESEPGHPHAFAFIEMDEDDADKAMRALDGADFMSLTLLVEEAKPEKEPSTEDL
jgi:RNA recognition motif-containing protein